MADTYFAGGDLQPMLDTLGIPVTVGTTTAKGIRDIADEAVASAEDGSVYGRLVTLIVKTGTFAGLVSGAAIAVEGANYTVKQVQLVDDGSLTRVRCAKV